MLIKNIILMFLKNHICCCKLVVYKYNVVCEGEVQKWKLVSYNVSCDAVLRP